MNCNRHVYCIKSIIYNVLTCRNLKNTFFFSRGQLRIFPYFHDAAHLKKAKMHATALKAIDFKDSLVVCYPDIEPLLLVGPLHALVLQVDLIFIEPRQHPHLLA